jgi:hypothetical protein
MGIDALLFPAKDESSHPNMNEFNFDLEDDHISLSAEDFAKRFGVSCAFVRLAIQNGCPTHCGLVSRAGLFEWMEDHHERIRAAAGFSSYPPLTETEATWRRSEKRKRAFLTALEFTETRACLPSTRRAAQEVSRILEENW